MPKQKPGKSEQVVSTPTEFLQKVQDRLNTSFSWDLAATDENTVVKPEIFQLDDQWITQKYHYTEADDSLIQPWHELSGWLWLNPPYSDITPWVRKAADEATKGAQIAMLVPASTGSNWWNAYVDGTAYITFLNGRITFVGHDKPYPKDLALLLYAPFLEGGSCVWRWK